MSAKRTVTVLRRSSAAGGPAEGASARSRALVVPEDRLFEPLQLGRRVDAELLDERLPCLAVRLERLGLTSRAVEREHQLAAQALPQRVAPRRGSRAPRPAANVGRARARRRRAPPVRPSEAPRAWRSPPARTARRRGRPEPARARGRAPRAGAPRAYRGHRPPTPAQRGARNDADRPAPARCPRRSRGDECARASRPSVLRRSEIRFWREPRAAFGGLPAQSSSIKRSVETTSPACSISNARRARCFRRFSSSARPSTWISNGPGHRTRFGSTERFYHCQARIPRSPT